MNDPKNLSPSQVNQPKNTVVFPLAGQIPEYRQARLAGKKYMGPIMNIAPSWGNVKPAELTAQTGKTYVNQYSINHPQSAKLEMGSFNHELDRLQVALSEKETELKKVHQNNQAQNAQLGYLQTERNATDSMVKNLKQELTNMQNNTDDNTKLSHLQQQIAEKEKETERLRQEIDELTGGVDEKTKLMEDIENYRKQIQEFTEQQKKLQNIITVEEEKIRSLTDKVEQVQTNASQTKPEQFQKFEKILEEASQGPLQAAPAIEKPAIPQSKTVNARDLEIRDTRGIPVLTQVPNAVNGIVKDDQGKLITDAIIIIKDKLNHNLRALKSNPLGQFVAATPLPNGQYYIQAEKKGYVFDTIVADLTGEKLNPIEITGHVITT
jgi:predicted  nucleic acid-binding Zn-ribbon protein